MAVFKTGLERGKSRHTAYSVYRWCLLFIEFIRHWWNLFTLQLRCKHERGKMSFIHGLYYSTLTFLQLKLWFWIFYPNQCFIEGKMIPSTVYALRRLSQPVKVEGGQQAPYDIILSHPFPAISSSCSAAGSRSGWKCFVSLSPGPRGPPWPRWEAKFWARPVLAFLNRSFFSCWQSFTAFQRTTATNVPS